MEIITLFKVLMGLVAVEVVIPDNHAADKYAKGAVEVAALATIGGGAGAAIGGAGVAGLTALEVGAAVGATAGVVKQTVQ